MSILERVDEAEWKAVITEGRRRGSLTLDEVLSVLGVELTIDVLTDIEAVLQPEGIRLDVEVNPDHTPHAPDPSPDAPLVGDEAVGAHDGSVIQRRHRESRAKRRSRPRTASGESGGSGDSVRLYLSEIGQGFYKILKQFAPFGPGNMAPVFKTDGVIDNGYGRIVGKNHLKLTIGHHEIASAPFSAIAFQQGGYFEYIRKGHPFHICYHIEENEWNNQKSLQLNIKDIKIPDSEINPGNK